MLYSILAEMQLCSLSLSPVYIPTSKDVASERRRNRFYERPFREIRSNIVRPGRMPFTWEEDL